MSETMPDGESIWLRALEIADEERGSLRDRVYKRLRAEFPGIRRARGGRRKDGPRCTSSGSPLMSPQPKGAQFPVLDVDKHRLSFALETLTIEFDR